MSQEKHSELIFSGEALFDAIAQLLDAHPEGDDAPALGTVDGLMAGLTVSPAPIQPEEWLPKLGLGPDDPVCDPDYRDRFCELLSARRAEIVGDLLEGGLAFAPYYDTGEDGETLWQYWLVGFLLAIGFRQKAWDKLFNTKDEDLGAALSGLMKLMATFPRLNEAVSEFDKDEIAELSQLAPDLIPYFVEVIYRRQHGLPRVVLDDDFDFDLDGEDWEGPLLPAQAPKVGRNQPCPCGSGKKYKKCCGG